MRGLISGLGRRDSTSFLLSLSLFLFLYFAVARPRFPLGLWHGGKCLYGGWWQRSGRANGPVKSGGGRRGAQQTRNTYINTLVPSPISIGVLIPPPPSTAATNTPCLPSSLPPLTPFSRSLFSSPLSLSLSLFATLSFALSHASTHPCQTPCVLTSEFTVNLCPLRRDIPSVSAKDHWKLIFPSSKTSRERVTDWSWSAFFLLLLCCGELDWVL